MIVAACAPCMAGTLKVGATALAGAIGYSKVRDRKFKKTKKKGKKTKNKKKDKSKTKKGGGKRRMTKRRTLRKKKTASFRGGKIKYGIRKNKVIQLYPHKINTKIGRHNYKILWKTTKNNLPGKTFHGKFYNSKEEARENIKL